MELHSQQKTLDVQKGLLLIKYESSGHAACPPTVRVSADLGSENSIELILPPDADEAVLWSPGATLVVRALRDARLRVIVTSADTTGSTSAKVQVSTLSNDPQGARSRVIEPLDLSGLRLLGHVAGRGDVVVDVENWVAGPSAPSRIEGIAIQWPNKPSSLDLRYAVTIGGPRPILGQLVEIGQFAGSRGRALPLVGATFEISGPAAVDTQLSVEAIFLGSPTMKVVGRRVVLSGPTGREPLVGIRLLIEKAHEVRLSRHVNPPKPIEHRQDVRLTAGAGRKSTTPDAVPQSAAVAELPATRSAGKGRVRVFRGTPRTRHSQA
jgi:hypothetical protein